MVESERVGSPLDTNIKYNLDLREFNDKEKSEYLELFGSTQCISNKSRPDIAYAANFLGRHRQKPTCQHLEQLKRVWRYLGGNRNLGLTLGGVRNLECLDLWLPAMPAGQTILGHEEQQRAI